MAVSDSITPNRGLRAAPETPITQSAFRLCAFGDFFKPVPGIKPQVLRLFGWQVSK
jgi:hypothetical protein